MIRRPPRSTRTDTLFPDTTLFRSQVETWMRDPYAVYARHVLRLRALDPIDADPGAAERGSLIHDALHRFVAAYPGALPPDAFERLLDRSEEHTSELQSLMRSSYAVFCLKKKKENNFRHRQ